MVDLVILQTASYLIAALSFAVTCGYYIINIMNTNKTRQAQTFLNLYQNYMTMMNSDLGFTYDHFKVRDYSEFINVWNEKESYRAMAFYSTFFEGLGVLVREKHIEVGLVARFCSGDIKGYWERYGGFVKQFRVDNKFPRFMVETEYLYRVISEYGVSHPELGISTPAEEFFASR